MQLSNPDLAVKSTQKYFYALDMNPDKFVPSIDDKVNLLKLDIQDAEKEGTLQLAASVFDHENNVIRDGLDHPGKRIITFSNVLTHGNFPLAEILNDLLQMGQQAMNNPVEIEFAVDTDNTGQILQYFNLLQIRPIVVNEQSINSRIEKINPSEVIIYSEKALGNGIYANISNIVYVKPETFKPAESLKIAQELEKVNEQFVRDQLSYLLIGPGRWGSSDPWLGIPIKWAHISAARIIVESGLEHFRVDPSQGTHFFHNLTTFGVGYLTVNHFMNDGIYNVEFLHSLPAVLETQYLRHVRFENPLKIEIDGKTNKAVVYKPN
jgi:hypothetical protein